jgi:hypothetical protein
MLSATSYALQRTDHQMVFQLTICLLHFLSFDLSLKFYKYQFSSLGENVSAMKKNAKSLLTAVKKIHLEPNTKKTKSILMSRHCNTEQYLARKRANILWRGV